MKSINKAASGNLLATRFLVPRYQQELEHERKASLYHGEHNGIEPHGVLAKDNFIQTRVLSESFRFLNNYRIRRLQWRQSAPGGSEPQGSPCVCLQRATHEARHPKEY
jgi:hypothetical protein